MTFLVTSLGTPKGTPLSGSILKIKAKVFHVEHVQSVVTFSILSRSRSLRIFLSLYFPVLPSFKLKLVLHVSKRQMTQDWASASFE